MKFVLLALSAALAFAGDVPRITFIKVFKGSKPDYISITIDRTGAASYKEAEDDTNPVAFQMPASDTRQIFELADRLNHFDHPLEGSAKVANMGVKIFRYQDGAEVHEVKFNYTDNADAKALADWFERISETEQEYIELDRALHFDKLGVNQALAQIQISYDRKRLAAPQQFLPLLDRIIKNDALVHIARDRAASLAESFRRADAGEAQ